MSDYYQCRSCNVQRPLTDEDNRCAVVCSNCHKSYCLNCKDEGHFPASCDDAGYWNAFQSSHLHPSVVKEPVKWVQDMIINMSEEIKSATSRYPIHDAATLQQHPELLHACNEIMKMLNIAKWTYVSYFYKEPILGDYLVSCLNAVILRCRALMGKYPAAVVPPEPETPRRFSCVSFLVRQPELVQVPPVGDPTYWDITQQRNDAAEVVRELLSYLINVYERPELDLADTSRAHMLQCLSSEKPFWDEIWYEI